jgi:hypothetical protein
MGEEILKGTYQYASQVSNLLFRQAALLLGLHHLRKEAVHPAGFAVCNKLEEELSIFGANVFGPSPPWAQKVRQRLQEREDVHGWRSTELIDCRVLVLDVVQSLDSRTVEVSASETKDGCENDSSRVTPDVIKPSLWAMHQMVQSLYALGFLDGQDLVHGCGAKQFLEGLPHEAPFAAIREKQDVGLVLEDEIVCDVVVGSARVDSSSTIEQSGNITRQIDCCSSITRSLLTQGRVCNRSK